MVRETGYLIPMKRRYSPVFIQTLKKADVRIRKSFKERIIIFARNPNDPVLKNHALKREYKGYRSIDITADWRAIYEVIETGDHEKTAYFIAIGTHKELYEKKK
jgi:addiction module RelE/StbE family toxin